MPTHHCSRCTSVLYDDDEACLACESVRPARGWTELGSTTDSWLGRVLADRYLLTQRIGHGASGNVYRAESMTIARQFAAKIIPFDNKSSTINPKHVEARLHREIEALGRLRNPHIVSFYDVVPLGGRAVALLMDLIQGQTLESLLSTGGPLTVLRACQILRQIANGVHEAHEAGMIHRDLKPENLMVERLPAGDDFVHILDFGIVWREGDVRVTQGFLGTPLYASPEQAVGGQLDRRADIYALGGVLFFMLTGRPPFVNDNVYKVLKAHVSTRAPKLVDVARNRNFPPEIEALVARMLAKSPADRPQTLAGVITTLDEVTRKLSEDSKASAHAQRVDSFDLQRNVTPDFIARESSVTESSVTESRVAESRVTESRVTESSEAHRTVQSEASLVEASKSHASRSAELEGALAEPSASDRAETSGFFRSDEWDSTGPKAAILRGRTPEEPLPVVERVGAESSFAASEAVEPPTSLGSSSFADGMAIRRNSGLYEIPRLTGQLPEGGLLCAAARGKQLIVVDATYQMLVGQVDQDFEVQFELPAEPGLTALCLQSDYAFTGHADGRVTLWTIADASSARLHQNASTAPVNTIDCDAGGQWLLFGTAVGGLYLAERRDAQLQPLRIQSGPEVRAVALSAPRDTFAVARADGSIGIFSISSPTSLVHRFSAEDRVERMAFSKDGYLLAVVFADKKLALYHVMTGKLVMRNDSMLEQPLSISFDDNNQLVGYCEVHGRIFGWDLHHNLVPHLPE